MDGVFLRRKRHGPEYDFDRRYGSCGQVSRDYQTMRKEDQDCAAQMSFLQGFRQNTTNRGNGRTGWTNQQSYSRGKTMSDMRRTGNRQRPGRPICTGKRIHANHQAIFRDPHERKMGSARASMDSRKPRWATIPRADGIYSPNHWRQLPGLHRIRQGFLLQMRRNRQEQMHSRGMQGWICLKETGRSHDQDPLQLQKRAMPEMQRYGHRDLYGMRRIGNRNMSGL